MIVIIRIINVCSGDSSVIYASGGRLHNIFKGERETLIQYMVIWMKEKVDYTSIAKAVEIIN
jgi:hypothetical protein